MPTHAIRCPLPSHCSLSPPLPRRLRANGKVVTYSRGGVVYVNNDGRTRKVAAGA